MIKSAVKNGDLVKCEISTLCGRVYQVVKFDKLVFLVELEKIANGLESLDLCDFWRVSGKYFRENFTLCDTAGNPAANFNK